MKTNFHTHTFRCNHAAGRDEGYVLSAIAGQYQILGFADHGPWPFPGHYRSHMRMDPQEGLQDYLKSVRALQKQYKDQIEIRIGLECEYFPPYMDWLRRMVQKEKLDYLILGNHFEYSEEKGIYFGRAVVDEAMLNRYVDSALEGMSTGLYAYLAHPDLFMRGYPSFDRYCEKASVRLCRAAKERGFALEYNLCGALDNRRTGEERYPHHLFWQIAAAEGCDVIIGVDAHTPGALEDDSLRREGIRLLEGYGAHLTDRIPYLSFDR